MAFNYLEYLGLVPIAAALIGEVTGSEQAVAAGQAFSVASPEPVSAWGHPFNLSFSGTPVTPPPADAPPAPVLSAWAKDVAILELGLALASQGEAAYAEASAGKAFSLSVTAGLFGHQQNLVLAGTPA